MDQKLQAYIDKLNKLNFKEMYEGDFFLTWEKTDDELEAVFTRTPTTNCKQCGKPFPVDGKRVYCSERCAEEAHRQQTAARVRKHRKKKQQM